jgi:hypothetical protein
LDERFRLSPQSRAAASRALQEPARVEDANLATRPFRLDPKAIDEILDFLAKQSSTHRSSNTIEPFQLQLICQRLEDIAAVKQVAEDKTGITLANLSGKYSLRRILKDFYKEEIESLSWRQRRPARKLCSEFLISPQGRRLRMEEYEIKRLLRVRGETLIQLADRRLLRADRTDSGTYYEISHDSLVKPILAYGQNWRILLIILSSLSVIVSGLVSLALLGYVCVLVYLILLDKSPQIVGRDHDFVVGMLIGAGMLFLLLLALIEWSIRRAKLTWVAFRRSRI